MERLDGQTAENTNEDLGSTPGGEQPVGVDTPDINLTTLPDTAPSDDAAAPEAGEDTHSPPAEAQPDASVAADVEEQKHAPEPEPALAPESEPAATLPDKPNEIKVKEGEEPDADSQIPSGDTPFEAGVATPDGSQSSHDDTIMMMVLNMAQGLREGGQVTESDNKVRSITGENSKVDAAEGEQDLLPQIQEPSSPEQREDQKLPPEPEEAPHAPTRLDLETTLKALLAAGGEPQGLRERRPLATNLTIFVERWQIGPRPRTAWDILHRKGRFLAEDSRTSRAIVSVANYIDGVAGAGRPSREDLQAVEQFGKYAAERARVLEKMLERESEDGAEPVEVLQRFDQQWQQRAMDEAWVDRQDLRLAAVRTALYVGQNNGNALGEVAVLGLEHMVAEFRRKKDGGFNDPVVLQTLEILRSAGWPVA